jgi:hypothetical protein
MEQVQPRTKERTPISHALEDVLHQAPLECFTLGWLMSSLPQRSFGVVLLVLGLLATTIFSRWKDVILAGAAGHTITKRNKSKSDPACRSQRQEDFTLLSSPGIIAIVAARLSIKYHPMP